MRAVAGFWVRFAAFAVLLIIGFASAQGQPPAAPAIKVVDLIPASLSGETNQDSEPFLAIQMANPQVMVASAFTPNPFSNTGNAPVYVSQDGGNSWVLNAITPVQRMTCDITHAMAAGENHPRGDLHAGTLACASSITLDESESNDVSSSTTTTVQTSRDNVDQPFVSALGVSSGDRIYVGVNDFNQAKGHHGHCRRVSGWRSELQIVSHRDAGDNGTGRTIVPPSTWAGPTAERRETFIRSTCAARPTGV